MKHRVTTVLHALVIRKIIVLALVASLLVTVVLPRPVRAQLFLAGLVEVLKTVYELIRNDLGKVLTQITGLTEWFHDFYQTFLFPQKAIEAARNFAARMSEIFRSLIGQVLRFPVGSSSLPATQSLEALIRNGSLEFTQMANAYRKVYGSIPEIREASPLDRNLIDVDDALALGSMKSLSAGEAMMNSSLGTADEIEDKIKDPKSAPGAAPFLSAAGMLAAIGTEVMTQRIIATQIRQEAALLAHRNTLLKRDALLASEMRGHIENLLKRK
jgi:hypothetical protein